MPALKRWIAFFGGLTLLLCLNDWYLGRLHAVDPTRRTHWLRQQHAEPFEYVVLGSSVANRCFDYELLKQTLGKPVINLSRSGTPFPEQRLILETFLQRNSGRVLLLQVDDWGITTGGYSADHHPYLYIPHLDDDAVRRNLQHDFGIVRTTLWRYLPMYGYGEYNDKIGMLSFTSRQLRFEFSERRFGPASPRLLAATLPATGDPRFAGREPWLPEESPIRIEALTQIVEIAQSHGMRVVACLPPVHRQWRETLLGYADRVAWYVAFFESRNIPLLTSDPAEAPNKSIHFADTSHMNALGARIYTEQLAKFVRSQNEATAMRKGRSLD